MLESIILPLVLPMADQIHLDLILIQAVAARLPLLCHASLLSRLLRTHACPNGCFLLSTTVRALDHLSTRLMAQSLVIFSHNR